MCLMDPHEKGFWVHVYRDLCGEACQMSVTLVLGLLSLVWDFVQLWLVDIQGASQDRRPDEVDQICMKTATQTLKGCCKTLDRLRSVGPVSYLKPMA